MRLADTIGTIGAPERELGVVEPDQVHITIGFCDPDLEVSLFLEEHGAVFFGADSLHAISIPYRSEKATPFRSLFS